MSESAYPQREILEGKIFALLSYLSIFCIIPLVFKRDNAFVLMHGKQGLVLFIIQVGIFIASIVLPWPLIKLFYFILGLLSLWGIVESLKGRFVRMPFIAEIADKIIL